MSIPSVPSCTAFVGTERVASGDLQTVALATKARVDAGDLRPVLVFDDATGNLVEIDFRGTAADVARRLPLTTIASSAGAPPAGDAAAPELASAAPPSEASSPAPGVAPANAMPIASPRGAAQVEVPVAATSAHRAPGRPRLGVVAREVTLLPRHWEWLGAQPGGASVALRKLVERARRDNEGADRVRRARETANRSMTVIAGDLPGFEEATRALFAGDGARFAGCIEAWPPDVADHARMLAGPAFDAGPAEADR